MLDEIRAERERKAKLLIDAGMDPYAGRSNRTHTIEDVTTSFSALADSKELLRIAGRVMSMRVHGGSAFVDLFDGTGQFQVFFSKEAVGEAAFNLLISAIDMGDFIEAEGTAFLTKRGAEALAATSWIVLTKALQAIPSEWYGIKDEDERYRKRYLDLLLNTETRDIVRKRAFFWQTIRKFLTDRGFVEVETPVLENTPGGAEARPFMTHHNALDIDLYLRISAGELWQKKLMVAGIPKTFEIGRIFRNEGMSSEHLQDYTQLEFYEAYSDFEKGMTLITNLYRDIAQTVFGTLEFKIRGFDIDLGKEWEIYDFSKIIEERFGLNPVTEEYKGKKVTEPELKEICAKAGIEYERTEYNITRTVDNLWKVIRKEIGGPGFLIGVPATMEPLAKRSKGDPRIVERFQVLIAGSEIGKGYSELNDPKDQKERFLEQQKLREQGDEEAQMADMEFVEALEYGMPPTFGFGLSERLFAFLMDKSARETQLFPLMRPKE